MATIDLFREKLKQTLITKTKVGKREEKEEEKRKYVCLGIGLHFHHSFSCCTLFIYLSAWCDC